MTDPCVPDHPCGHWTPEPDVWWGADGIDALLWADPMPPYVVPVAADVAEAPSEPEIVR